MSNDLNEDTLNDAFTMIRDAKLMQNGFRLTATAPASPQQSDWTDVAASARCWSQIGDAYFPVAEVVSKLPAGAYRCRDSQRGIYLEKMPIEIDNLLALPDSTVEKLMDEFRKFWTLRQNFAERGFTFKRGLFMWGPPGSGKTSAIWQMTQELVRSQDGIVVFVEHPAIATVAIGALRRIEPDRPMVTVMEDIDALVTQFGEHALLALLDGENQVSNVIHVATTNYPECLDRRFVDRPSRFDTIMEVGMPTAEARRSYLTAKEPSLDQETIERWVKKSDDYSIAHLREVIVAVRCLGQDEAAAFKRLDQMREQHLSSDGRGGTRNFNAGFLRNLGEAFPQ